MEVNEELIQRLNCVIADFFEKEPNTTYPFTEAYQRSPEGEWVTEYFDGRNLRWVPYYRYASDEKESRRVEIFLVSRYNEEVYQDQLREYKRYLSQIILDRNIHLDEILNDNALECAQPWQRALAFIKYHRLENKLELTS